MARLPLVLLLAAVITVDRAQPQEGTTQAAGTRVALLIGNEEQPGEAARSPALQTIADQLQQLGFSATTIENASRTRMADAIRETVGRVRKGSTALFLFRGAMLRVGQKNFIMPADAASAPESDIRQVGLALDGIEGEFSRQGAEIKIIVIDASRSEAAAARFGTTLGVPAPLDLHDGTLAILNSSRDRSTDGSAQARDDNVFLTELLKQTAVPNVTGEQAFSRTRVAVARETAGRQVPSVSSSLLNDFYFVSDRDTAAAGTEPAPPPAQGGTANRKEVASETVKEPRPSPPPAQPSPPPPQPVVKAAAPQPGEIFKDCEHCPEVVVVPPGDFTMGSNDDGFEKPPHRVALPRPFAIGRYEVTFAQWDACAAAGACRSDIDDHGYGRGRQPVIDVSWDEVQAYLKWLSAQTKQVYRLPSEAEWEYAARAGSRTAFPWGGAAGSGKANCDDCNTAPARAPQAVGAYRPNAFGLFDTVGNAAEWVDDCWHGGYRNAPSDGSSWHAGECGLRVLRGGSFASKAAATRSSARFRYDHDVRYYTNSFRVLRELPAGG